MGGAIALYLLFDLPLMLGAIITAAVAMIVLRIGDLRGQQTLERVIVGFLALIAVGFMAGLFVDPPEAGPLAGGLVPSFEGTDSVLLASGIIGATVMPHVIYLHSSLTITRLDRRGEGLTVRRAPVGDPDRCRPRADPRRRAQPVAAGRRRLEPRRAARHRHPAGRARAS